MVMASAPESNDATISPRSHPAAFATNLHDFVVRLGLTLGKRSLLHSTCTISFPGEHTCCCSLNTFWLIISMNSSTIYIPSSSSSGSASMTCSASDTNSAICSTGPASSTINITSSICATCTSDILTWRPSGHNRIGCILPVNTRS